MKLGAIQSPPDDRDLMFAHYRTDAPLPTLPRYFGYEREFPVRGWGMLGNDEVGDCTCAGAAHEHMLWEKAAGRDVTFSTEGVLAAYAAITGYDGTEATDRGAVIRDVLKYRQATGIVDADHTPHKIGPYLRLDPSDHHSVWEAVYLCGAIGIGFSVPESAMDQFRQGRMWSYVEGSPIEGGHYVPLVARRRHWGAITWAQVQWLGHRFWDAYVTEAWAILSPDWIADSGAAPTGLDYAAIAADLEAL